MIAPDASPPVGARLEGVRKRVGATEILRGLDLEIRAGEFTILLGPSGCGKSTTLRILAGLERQTGGRVLIGGRDVSELEPRERDVAMVFQSYALYPTMTVAENIGFGLRVRGVARGEAEARVRETAELLGVAALLDRTPAELSGGQQQRVAIGRAIVRRPALFLFDEPLSNLDARLRVRMRGELMRLHRALGATTVFVTHDQEEALSMADRIVVMDGGRIAQIGTPFEVFRAPASTMVADFIGNPAMNLVPGDAEGGRVTTALGTIAAECAHVGPVTVGFRPDDAQILGRDPLAEPSLLYDAVVELVELLGSRGVVTLRCGDTQTRIVVAAGETGKLAPETPVQVAVPGASLHLFRADGRRLISASGESSAPSRAGSPAVSGGP